MKNLIAFVALSFCINFAQTLNPGDGVKILFYNIPEKITGDYFIQNDGNLQLPYIGLIETKDKDFKVLEREIFSKYDSLYKEPELTVQPLLKINILGEVRQPGFYFITGIEKLSGVFAMAGGETADADIEGTYIIRDNVEIELGEDKVIADGNTVVDMGLRSGDRIVVPRRWWVGARNTAIIVSGAAVVVTLIGIFVR